MRSIALSLLIAGTAHAQTVRFVNDAAPDNGDGLTWATAYSDLHSGLGDLEANQLWVVEGTYIPASFEGGGPPVLISFTLRSGLAVYGGFSGNETLLAERDPEAHPTILSGDIDNGEEHSRHVVRASNVDRSAVLDGFTITQGVTHTRGGGLVCESGSPTIAHCVFLDNASVDGFGDKGFGGGGVATDESSAPLISDCVFENNWAGIRFGGGILNWGGSPVIERCTFIDNACLFGLSIYSRGGSMTVRDCDFLPLIGAEVGGGVYLWEGSHVIEGCTFTGIQGDGGCGLTAAFCSASIAGCKFIDNRASLWGGAGILSAESTLQISDSLFTGNCSWSNVMGKGSAIHAAQASVVTLHNCEVHGNCRPQMKAETGSVISGGFDAE